MEKSSFKVSAEVLQRNAMKSSIRDLNAEFQMKGGLVTPSKKGDTYQLSHPDEVYLEEFRIRLFKELGLLEEKDIPKELKGPQAPPPRYGDHHMLRRGWNVRSQKEIRQGVYDDRDRMKAEGTEYLKMEEGRGRFNDRWEKGPRRDERTGRHPGRDGSRNLPRDAPGEFPGPSLGQGAPGTDEEGEDGTKSFEERWGDISSLIEIINEAIDEGAVDDGMIIRYAYNKGVQEEDVRKLKKVLWDNRCRGKREKCPHGKKKLRFEELMKVCSGKVEGWDRIDSPFIRFLDRWNANMDKMYGPYRDRIVRVKGKVSSCKPVHRKGHEHLKVLVYDTLVTDLENGGTPGETRKLWIKITLHDFQNILKDTKVHIDDQISFVGKCIYDKYFHDYWIIDLKEMEVLEEGGGEVLTAPMP
ncbi:MAG: hypothetical protein JW939_03865 [Candidatus Thermoplasmatota archaeon]|nr:hypothetical protein [Candidatus Thermoplasmatota archaeon]